MQIGTLTVDVNLLQRIDLWSNSKINHARMANKFGPEIQFSPNDKKLMDKILNTNNSDEKIEKLKTKITIINKLEEEYRNRSVVQLAFWHCEKKGLSLCGAIGYIVTQCIHYFFNYNSCHIEMNIKPPLQKDQITIGWGWSGRYYGREGAKNSRVVELYDLDVDNLFGGKVNAAAKDIFFHELHKYVRTDYTIIPGRFTQYCHAFTHLSAEKVNLQSYFENEFKTINEPYWKRNANYCSSVPTQLIILAHLKTCQELGLEMPKDLSHYGLNPNEVLANITPERLQETLIAKEIFKTHFSPFRYVE